MSRDPNDARALRAVLWDVDGTLAETERDGHLPAFNEAFTQLGVPWRWTVSGYGELLRVTGGRERLVHDMAGRPDAPAAEHDRLSLAARLHVAKNRAYAARVLAGAIPLREGVGRLLAQCAARGMRMAIVTTTSRGNVEALLRVHLGMHWEERFAAVVCGEDVDRKKPDPQAYGIALDRLGIESAQAIAIEDSPVGAAAAHAAGVPVVVTRSVYFADDAIEGALAVGPGLHQRSGWQVGGRPLAIGTAPDDAGIGLDELIAWHSAH